MTLPSVAVLGAGPSGLAAAKVLLEHGPRPVVFEVAPHPGGMCQAAGRGAWSDFARTNISNYSCGFSDLAWPADSEVFPLRSDLARYLQLYADRFFLMRHERFATNVDAVRPDGDGRWRIAWHDDDCAGAGVFDHIVIAGGSFAAPFRPEFPGLADFSGDVLHSADCGTAATLHARCSGKRVLVVGAAFSGTEIAAELARYARLTVTLRHPMWYVSRWVQATDGGPHYPLDLVIYNRREDNPLLRDPHLFLRRVGGDPGAASDELSFDRGAELPMTIIISDEFLDLVRDGAVAVKRSATLRFDRDGVTYAGGANQPFDVVILCIGFSTELACLDPATLGTLGTLGTLAFDGMDQLQPKLLHRSMFHPDLPGMTFVGHYRGPYFPVMELQSRSIARILAGELPTPDRITMLAGVAEEKAIRARMQRPQFPHGDFVGLADGPAREIGVFPTLADSDPLLVRVVPGTLVPAQYRLTGPHAKPELACAMSAATPAPVLDDPPLTARPVLGRRVLALLRGNWAIDRQIQPGGHFIGTAAFTQRSADSLLYREFGKLTLDSGAVLSGENGYVYSLRNGNVEVSFADGPSRGMHFIDISLPDDRPNVLPVACVDRHQCRLDTYDATFNMETSAAFEITYTVRGPKKGYVSRSIYRRLDGSQ